MTIERIGQMEQRIYALENDTGIKDLETRTSEGLLEQEARIEALENAVGTLENKTRIGSIELADRIAALETKHHSLATLVGKTSIGEIEELRERIAALETERASLEAQIKALCSDDIDKILERIDELERRLNYLLGGGLSSYDGGLIATQQQRIAALESERRALHDLGDIAANLEQLAVKHNERIAALETWRNVHVQNDTDPALSLSKRVAALYEPRDEFERKLDEIRRIIEGK
jgi:phage host-nuclease inhibitor protein Gam